MKLIPYFSCEKMSDKPSAEVMQILKTNIAADSYSLLTYKNYTFTIERNINHRNSFLPIAFGSITKTSENSSVNIFIRMHWVIIIFLFIWFTFFFERKILQKTKTKLKNQKRKQQSNIRSKL